MIKLKFFKKTTIVLRNCCIGSAITMIICLLPSFAGLFVPGVDALRALNILSVILVSLGTICVLVMSIIPVVLASGLTAACRSLKNDCYICPNNLPVETCEFDTESKQKDCYLYKSDYNFLCKDLFPKLQAAVIILFLAFGLMLTACYTAIAVMILVKKTGSTVVAVQINTSPNTVTQPVGQPIGQPYPGQPYPGQPVGQPYPGQPYPGQPYPGQPYPGQPYPGQPVNIGPGGTLPPQAMPLYPSTPTVDYSSPPIDQ